MSAPATEPRAGRRAGFWRARWAMLIKEFIQLRRDRVSFAMIVMIPLMQLAAVRLCHQHHAARICRPRCCCRRRAISAARSSRRCRTPAISTSPIVVARRGRVRPPAARRARCCSAIEIPADFERAVRRGDRPALLVAADATDPVAVGLGAGGARQPGADRAAARPRAPGQRHAAVRDPHPRPLQSGGRHRAQHRAGPARHHPHHDHADLHRAVGDARDRARHHGKPAGDADHAGRDHARQDRPLRRHRLHAGDADRRHRHAACSACRSSAACRCSRCSARCSSPPICRSATPSRPSRRTSCRRCRCRSCSSCRTSCCRASCSRSPACRAGRNGSARRCRSRIIIRIVRAIMLKGATLADLHYDALALLGLMLLAMTIAVTPLPPDAGLIGAA